MAWGFVDWARGKPFRVHAFNRMMTERQSLPDDQIM
jgi:hypothetical protein